MIEALERIRVSHPQGGHPGIRPDRLGGDKAYSSRRNRRCLRSRQIKHTIPEPKDQRANRERRGSKGRRPPGFDCEIYKRRNDVERTINRLKNSRAIATRHDKRAYRLSRHRHHRSRPAMASGLSQPAFQSPPCFVRASVVPFSLRTWRLITVRPYGLMIRRRRRSWKNWRAGQRARLTAESHRAQGVISGGHALSVGCATMSLRPAPGSSQTFGPTPGGDAR